MALCRTHKYLFSFLRFCCYFICLKACETIRKIWKTSNFSYFTRHGAMTSACRSFDHHHSQNVSVLVVKYREIFISYLLTHDFSIRRQIFLKPNNGSCLTFKRFSRLKSIVLSYKFHFYWFGYLDFIFVIPIRWVLSVLPKKLKCPFHL